MSKINPKMLHLHPQHAGKLTVSAKIESMHGIPASKMTKAAIADSEPQVHSAFDFSTEEYGYFLHNGKVVNIIFPR